MSLYRPIWPEIPKQQYRSLSPPMRQEFDAQFARILNDPKGCGDYDKRTDQWTATFAGGRGIIVYAVNDEFVTVIVLRIVDGS